METKSIMIELVGRHESDIDAMIEAGLKAMVDKITPGEFDAAIRSRTLDDLDHLGDEPWWDLDEDVVYGYWDDIPAWDTWENIPS